MTSQGFLTNQATLPRLPVPPLKDTLNRYLLSLKPLLTSIEYKQTKVIVSEFGKSGGIGEQLTEILKNRAKKCDNWLAEWWKNYEYLEPRHPIVVYTNLSILYPRLQFRELDGQLEYAAMAAVACLRYFEKIVKGTLEVDAKNGNPLCMIQYTKLFGSCRIPNPKRDTYYLPEFNMNQSRHIIVLHSGYIYLVNFYTVQSADTEVIVSPIEMLHLLRKIVMYSQPDDSVDCIGLLTSNDRDSWAEAYIRLSKDPQNAKNLFYIHTSLFALCLDSTSPEISGNPNSKDYSDNYRAACSKFMLHGGGSDYNSGNRWFDKTLQLIISPCGSIGANFEHIGGDGAPFTNAMDYVYNYCLNNRINTTKLIDHNLLPTVKLLSWNVTHDNNEDIIYAAVKLNQLIKDLDLMTVMFASFGSRYVKANKLSPDGFFQVAMQLTYYRLHGRSPSTYESCGMRRFLLGRTETIRSATIQSDNFACAMDHPNFSKLEKRELMLQAINYHREIVLEAKSGLGWDRHLLGMKLAAFESGIELPALYKDAGYIKSSHISLTTSQISSRCETCVLSFGPTEHHCYGVCYNCNSDNYIYTCTAFKSSSLMNCTLFADGLHQSLLNMQSLLPAMSEL